MADRIRGPRYPSWDSDPEEKARLRRRSFSVLVSAVCLGVLFVALVVAVVCGLVRTFNH